MSTYAPTAAGARRLASAARFPLVLILLLALSLPAAASDWRGRSETRDGVAHVMNPDQPMESAQTLPLKELWRLGGDSEDENEFFGLISRIITDADGNVYLLDSQLSEVKVYSADGEYLNTLGREGEGPGEFMRANSVFFAPGGTIGVLQAAPARLVRLTHDGEPAGDFDLPTREDGGFRIFMGAQSAGDQLYFLYMDQIFDQGHLTQNWTLSSIDAEAQAVAEYYNEARELDFANLVIDEEKLDTVQNRWMVGHDGRVYAAASHDRYEIMSWEADGGGARVIERDYDSYKRDSDQKQEMYDLYEAFTRQAPNATIKVSDNDADVFRFYPREDGSLWVLSSRGVRERPEGALGVFDVFDADGRFVRRVTLMGEGDPRQDGLHFMGDRLYVVTDLISAALALQGGGVAGGEEEEEAAPMAVICYRIGS
ncbi:MAG: 6-bladed beta-propeller [Candidatus Krumholzibacteriota bacterium]|nr:6-bladed beta-propeller [Candidatus Krumholzibacteriota bacterium]